MGHLTVDTIIRFVSLKQLNPQALTLAAAVNGHIRKCGRCRKLVNAFQLIYDEFTLLKIDGDFHRYAGVAAAQKGLDLAQAQEDWAGDEE